MDDNQEHPLAPLCRAWLAKIRLGARYKKKVFGEDARESMQFFNGPHNWMFDNQYARKRGTGYLPAGEEDEAEIAPPSFRMTVNKVSEVRDLYGPALYHRNPNIVVTPETPPVPPPQSMGIPGQPPQPPMNARMIPGPMGPQPDPTDPAVQQYQAQAMQYQQMMQQYGALMQQQADEDVIKQYIAVQVQYMLNYCQRELDKKTEARTAIDQALTTGIGVLWTDVVEREGFIGKLVGSFYDSEANLVLDPDAKVLKDVLWCAKKCTEPVWQVEEKYGLEKGSLKSKGNAESSDSQSDEQVDDTEYRDRKARGKTNDLLTYWEVYSKMGIGDKLKGSDESRLPDFDDSFAELGPYIKIVVAQNVPYPLNLPSELLVKQPDPNADPDVPAEEDDSAQFSLPRTPVVDPQTVQPPADPNTGMPQVDPETGQPETEIDPEIATRLWWPIPFWAMENGWPWEWICYRTVPGQLYPMPFIKPAIGEIRFVNWVMSFLASKITRSCTTTVAVLAETPEKIKQQLLANKDFSVVELEAASGKKIDELVSVLQYPEVNGDIWKILEAVLEMIAKRLGLNDLMYGQTATQDRSAAESQAKQSATQLRPDDMANMTEDWLSNVAAKEAMASRWIYEPQDVQLVMGPLAAQFWAQHVQSTEIETVVRQFDYRIEAGSTRKPNKQGLIASINQAAQNWGAFLENWAMKTGDVSQINALMQAWGKANDISMPPLQPPPAPPQGQPPGHPDNPQHPPSEQKAA